MPNLDVEGFENPLNRNVPEDGNESEKGDDDDGGVGVNIPEGLLQAHPHAYLNDPIQQRLQQLKDMIARIPGSPRPMQKATLNSYVDSPFADPIALIEVPKRFSVPTKKLYDGTTNPNDRVAQYK